MDPTYRHQISDELESMLYVVLYCCLRWIPHKTKVKQLGSLVHNFFYSVADAGGDRSGGFHKRNEKAYRSAIQKLVDFSCEHVKKWIADMYELLSPVVKGNTANWNKDSVWILWKNMTLRDLPERDRVEHDVGPVIGERKNAPEGARSRITQGSSSTSASKRLREHTSLIPEPSSKKYRQDNEKGDT